MNRDKDIDNSHVYKLERRKAIAEKEGKCGICQPHGGENRNYYKHGKGKPKYKDHRIDKSV